MHEISLIQGVVQQVLDLRAAGVFQGRVEAVRLKVGRLAAALPDQLLFAWQVLTEGTELEGTRLLVEEVPIRARCLSCHAENEISDLGFLCSKCGSSRVEIRSGRELLIDSLEVQDDP